MAGNYTTLDRIIRQVLNEQYESSPHRYARYLQFGYDCIRDHLQFLFPYYLRTVKLPVNSNNTVDLPADYVKYTKIGYDQNGTLELYSLDESFNTLLDRDACGNLLAGTRNATDTLDTQINTSTANVWFSNFYWQGAYGTLYGYRNSYNPKGNYKIYHQGNQLAFDSLMTATEIILEYKCNGVKSEGEEIVPIEAVPVIRYYIHMMSRQQKKSVGAGEKREDERRFGAAMQEARHKILMFTEKEFLDTWRKGYSQAIKG